MIILFRLRRRSCSLVSSFWSLFVVMVRHRLLQNYERHYAMGCVTGCLGCRWRRFRQSTEPANLSDLVWFWFLVVVVTGFMLFWFYYWILSSNSMADLNWYAFQETGVRLPMYSILLLLTCAALAYVLLLDVLALCHVALGHQLHIHWTHRTVLVLTLASSAAAVVLLDCVWKDGWQLQTISLMITGPFLHVSAVALMTFLTWFISGWILDGNFTNCPNGCGQGVVRSVSLGVYVCALVALYVCPVFIRSPCIGPRDDLPSKPLLVAHKGASSIAPENTVAAFLYATEYKVLVLESDVSVSLDGVPFVHHDGDLRRTTNVDAVFPSMKSMAACWFNISQLQQLDAGSWFIENRPFGGGRGGSLSDRETVLFRNQTIPRLTDLLSVALRTNDTGVMFDIKMIDDRTLCDGHPHLNDSARIIVDAILRSGLPNERMWWLYHDKLDISTNFTKVSNNRTASPRDLRAAGISIVNFGFSDIFWNEISAFNAENISVNMYVVDSAWLFSLCWCMGVRSVTTNRCSDFYDISRPVWHLTPAEFLVLCLATDFLSLVIVIVIWTAQRFRRNVFIYRMESSSSPSPPSPPGSGMLRPSKQQLMKEKLLFCGDSNSSDQEIALSEVDQPDQKY